jgi:hypothetical protein
MMRTLRNYIPIAAPGRREPADGTETPMRVSLGFEPAWYTHRCGTDFGENWHRDPRERYRSLKAAKAELARAFPTVERWSSGHTGDLATISGVHGAYFVPLAFGMSLIYARDRWPVLDPAGRLTLDQIERLEPRTALESPVVEELFRQMDVIEREWGPIDGYINWQGVLNNAFHLRGEELYLDMFDRPDATRRLFELITDVMIGLAKKVQARQRASGFPIDQLDVSNCVMNMISPEAYDEFVRPCDARIAGSFEHFGVHTCNWDVTPYIEVLSRLPKMGYLDMGIMSDMARVRATFPDARRAVLYSPVSLHSESLQTIRGDMEKIRRDLAPCDVVMADVQAATPDERIRDFLAICRELEAAGP